LCSIYQQHLVKGRFHEIRRVGDVADASGEALDSCLASPSPVKLRSWDGLHLGVMISGGISSLVTIGACMRRAASCLGITLIDP
jgi:hypothetical protein